MSLEVQAVLFPRSSWTARGAKAWLKENKYVPIKRVHKTKHFCRYRIIDPAKFSDYRTTILDDGIHLVMGITHPQDGEGKVTDYIRDKAVQLGNRLGLHQHFDRFTNSSLRVLKRFGDAQIRSITIYRTPVQKYVMQLLNVVSSGKFAELQKKASYDKLFHLAMVVNADGQYVIVQKNEVIEISTTYKTSDDTEIMEVPMIQGVHTLNELLEATRKRIGDNNFFIYDPLTLNCQQFIKNLLETAGVYTDRLGKFIYQPLGDIVAGLPTFAKWVARAATDLAATGRKLVGNGKK